FQSVHSSSFLIDAHEQRDCRGTLVLPDDTAKGIKGICRRNILLEEQDAADFALLYFGHDSVVDSGTRHTDEDHLADLDVQAVDGLTPATKRGTHHHEGGDNCSYQQHSLSVAISDYFKQAFHLFPDATRWHCVVGIHQGKDQCFPFARYNIP